MEFFLFVTTKMPTHNKWSTNCDRDTVESERTTVTPPRAPIWTHHTSTILREEVRHKSANHVIQLLQVPNQAKLRETGGSWERGHLQWGTGFARGTEELLGWR